MRFVKLLLCNLFFIWLNQNTEVSSNFLQIFGSSSCSLAVSGVGLMLLHRFSSSEQVQQGGVILASVAPFIGSGVFAFLSSRNKAEIEEQENNSPSLKVYFMANGMLSVLSYIIFNDESFKNSIKENLFNIENIIKFLSPPVTGFIFHFMQKGTGRDKTEQVGIENEREDLKNKNEMLEKQEVVIYEFKKNLNEQTGELENKELENKEDKNKELENKEDKNIKDISAILYLISLDVIQLQRIRYWIEEFQKIKSGDDRNKSGICSWLKNPASLSRKDLQSYKYDPLSKEEIRTLIGLLPISELLLVEEES